MITIIIPVYNASKHLRTCVNSVLQQTYKNLEIICINDGSTDYSAKILKDFAVIDNRIKIISFNTNKGVEHSRITGINNAHGKYIFFLDSDDYIHKTCLERLRNIAEHENVGYVETGCYQCYGSGFVKLKKKHSICGIIKQPELIHDYYISFFGKNILTVTLWGKLFRADYLYNHFPQPLNVKFGEDLYCICSMFPHLNSIYIDDSNLYYYRVGSGMSHKYMPSLLDDTKKLFLARQKLALTDKHIMYLTIEAANMLSFHILQRKEYKIDNNIKDLEHYIQNLLSTPFWQEIRTYLKNLVENKSNYIRAVIDSDIVYLVTHSNEKITIKIKKILRKILSLF